MATFAVILSGQSAQVVLCWSEIQDGPMAHRAVGQNRQKSVKFLVLLEMPELEME